MSLTPGFCHCLWWRIYLHIRIKKKILSLLTLSCMCIWSFYNLWPHIYVRNYRIYISLKSSVYMTICCISVVSEAKCCFEKESTAMAVCRKEFPKWHNYSIGKMLLGVCEEDLMGEIGCEFWYKNSCGSCKKTLPFTSLTTSTLFSQLQSVWELQFVGVLFVRRNLHTHT